MTKQDLEQIRRYFLEKGIRDTDLRKANPLDGTEIWGVVQAGRSVKTSLKDLLVFLKPLMEQNESLFCGFHTSEQQLKGLHPSAKEGSYAWVITTNFPDYPGEVYTYSILHGWVATGIKASDETKVELDEYIKSEEVGEIEKLPDYTASRAIMDGSGNIIEDTYVRRDELITGQIKGDSYIPNFNTGVFSISKTGSQYPTDLSMTLRAISGTGYVRNTQGMFEVYGVSAGGTETLIGGSTALTHEFSLRLSVDGYRYIKAYIYQDLEKRIQVYERVFPIVTDGTDGTNGTNGTDGTNGTNGTNGTDGKTPYIGANGNWWIGGEDTGVLASGTSGTPGEPGQTPTIEISSKDTWVINGVDTGKRTNGRPYLITGTLTSMGDKANPLFEGYVDKNIIQRISTGKESSNRCNTLFITLKTPSAKIKRHIESCMVMTPCLSNIQTAVTGGMWISGMLGRSSSSSTNTIVMKWWLWDTDEHANRVDRTDCNIYVPAILDDDYMTGQG